MEEEPFVVHAALRLFLHQQGAALYAYHVESGQVFVHAEPPRGWRRLPSRVDYVASGRDGETLELHWDHERLIMGAVDASARQHHLVDAVVPPLVRRLLNGDAPSTTPAGVAVSDAKWAPTFLLDGSQVSQPLTASVAGVRLLPGNVLDVRVLRVGHGIVFSFTGTYAHAREFVAHIDKGGDVAVYWPPWMADEGNAAKLDAPGAVVDANAAAVQLCPPEGRRLAVVLREVRGSDGASLRLLWEAHHVSNQLLLQRAVKEERTRRLREPVL